MRLADGGVWVAGAHYALAPVPVPRAPPRSRRNELPRTHAVWYHGALYPAFDITCAGESGWAEDAPYLSFVLGFDCATIERLAAHVRRDRDDPDRADLLARWEEVP